jgi:hypothetical protein
MSDQSIDKGTVGIDEIAKALDGIKLGIVCLTPENLESRWIHYEAGALAKSVDPATRLWTYLIGGLENTQIQPPLGRFQSTKAEKEDTRTLVHSVNKAVSLEPVPAHRIDTLFDSLWPDFERELRAASKESSPKAEPPNVTQMISEILAWTRGQSRREVYPEDATALLLSAIAKNAAEGQQPSFADTVWVQPSLGEALSAREQGRNLVRALDRAVNRARVNSADQPKHEPNPPENEE